jgi:biopolymer transport protein TolR
MGVSMGKTGNSEVADINMTPLIDVLLVLLVIFIIVQMQMQRAFDIQLPVDSENQANPNNTNIIMEIAGDGGIKINTKAVQPAALGPFLKEIYDQRPDKIIFVKASPDAQYGQVIQYIDVAREAGVKVIGAMLTPTVAGPTSTP